MSSMQPHHRRCRICGVASVPPLRLDGTTRLLRTRPDGGMDESVAAQEQACLSYILCHDKYGHRSAKAITGLKTCSTDDASSRPHQTQVSVLWNDGLLGTPIVIEQNFMSQNKMRATPPCLESASNEYVTETEMTRRHGQRATNGAP